MQMSGIPFGTTDWFKIEQTEHEGEWIPHTGALEHFGSIRVRIVEYTPGYLADHWCTKGTSFFVPRASFTLNCTTVASSPSPWHELSSCRQRRTPPLIHEGWAKLFVVD